MPLVPPIVGRQVFGGSSKAWYRRPFGQGRPATTTHPGNGAPYRGSDKSAEQRHHHPKTRIVVKSREEAQGRAEHNEADEDDSFSHVD